jgi:hypothetical protein
MHFEFGLQYLWSLEEHCVMLLLGAINFDAMGKP